MHSVVDLKTLEVVETYSKRADAAKVMQSWNKWAELQGKGQRFGVCSEGIAGQLGELAKRRG